MDFICPYKCSYRTSSGYCGRTGGWESCQYRQLHQPNTVVGYVPPLKKTNADRIRAMTDEELAEWMALNTDCYYCRAKDDGRCASLATTPCGDVWLDWLKQEAENGEN